MGGPLSGRRLVVLAGGWSAEAEVSRRSGTNVHDALVRLGAQAELLEFTPDFAAELKARAPELVVVMLHGSPGEDGSVQGALELLGIPYTGSGVTASAVGMDKHLSKLLFRQAGLAVLPSELVSGIEDAFRVGESIGYPVITKPRREGSSIGVEIIYGREGLGRAAETLLAKYGEFILEKYVKGKDVVCGVLGTGESAVALPTLELDVVGQEFYDYKAKYTEGETRFIIPAAIESNEEVAETALAAHRLLGCRDFSRSDFVIGDEGGFILELNTIPGMTDLSDLPAEADFAGISYDRLVLDIVRRGLNLD